MNVCYMPVTLKDISKKSGFSVTTVSRALTGYDDVSQQTRQRILKIANDLGYQPNQIARQLQGQRTATIGLIMPPPEHTIDEDFFSILLKGITYEAALNGYDLLTSASHPHGSELEAYKRIVGGNRVDGIVVARTYRNDARIAYLQEADFPFIVHGRLAPDEVSDFHYIDVDSQKGIRIATEHLIERGHQEIGLILPDKNIAFTPYRLAGYQDALSKHGIDFNADYCINGKLTYASGLLAAQELLNKHPQLTAIVGCNDWMALGALSAAQELGYTVGEDFAVVGYDDIPAAALSNPKLTTIRQQIYDIGEQLVQQLLTIINDDPTTYFQRLLEPELIIRDSSGGVR